MVPDQDLPGCAAWGGADAGSTPLDITVSVVSHDQGQLVQALLRQLATLGAGPRRVILTFNRPEAATQAQLATTAWPFELLVSTNARELGFGANHNAAFRRDAERGASTAFAVINPDIRLEQGNPFATALQILREQPQVGLVYPRQVDVHDAPQDHQRLLPTPMRVLRRALGRRHELPAGVAPDWVNAALVVLRPAAFAAVSGFDAAYRMYCEDVDLCLRLRLAGWKLAAADATVVHAAERASHRSMKYLMWHLRSLWRLWRSETYAAYRARPGDAAPRS